MIRWLQYYLASLIAYFIILGPVFNVWYGHGIEGNAQGTHMEGHIAHMLLIYLDSLQYKYCSIMDINAYVFDLIAYKWLY